MLINLFADNARHKNIGIKLVEHQIKQRHIKGRLRALRISYDRRRHGADKRPYNRHHFRKNGKQAKN